MKFTFNLYLRTHRCVMRNKAVGYGEILGIDRFVCETFEMAASSSKSARVKPTFTYAKRLESVIHSAFKM